jgi:hypothetical protein
MSTVGSSLVLVEFRFRGGSNPQRGGLPDAGRGGFGEAAAQAVERSPSKPPRLVGSSHAQ